MSEDRHGIGANNPPQNIFERIDSLYGEAKLWMDGAAIETDAQAAGLGALIDMLSDAGKACEAERKEKVKPLDDAKKDIQALYKPPLDNVDRALKAAKTVRDVWLKKQQAIIDEKARIAREEADKARREAEKEREKTLRERERDRRRN